jgi:hypothetical protein
VAPPLPPMSDVFSDSIPISKLEEATGTFC